ncbi:Uma2 family endonuclease [Antarcticirhabdus aurantiaca]|nr:Uma2 family endonuclease [Antarcticirhabdus aurantiaca]
MNIQVPTIRTADDFLAWNEGREGRREFVRGRIVEMIGGSHQHAELAGQLLFLLKLRLPADRYSVTPADFAVRTPFGIRYPDVMVSPRGIGPRDLATAEALLIGEVLSPSSVALDFGEKMQEYTALPALLHYVVLSQDEPRVWLWRRGEDGAFGSPEMITGHDAVLPLAGFGIELPLAELYRGIA